MPSSHLPIKKYNYERSLYRWLMSRHPEPFEKHGITTKTLERAPLAREAFYRSGWLGAKVLVQNNEDNKFERTDFFDQIIERGLGHGDTRFSVEHVKSDEQSKLGITLDSATGKYYLQAYGSAKTRRPANRRNSAGSVSSSDADHDPAEPPHPMVKEVGDLIASEIEAAGEDAEVRLDKSRLERASPSGSMMLTFSISIRRRATIGGAAAAAAGSDDSGGCASGQRAGDAGATADAGAGDPTGRGMPPQAQAARPAQTVSTTPPPPPLAAGARHMEHHQRPPAGMVSTSSSPCTPGMTGARQQHQQEYSRKRDAASVLEADAATLASVSQVGAKKHKEGVRSRSSSSPPGASATGVASFGSGAGRDAMRMRTQAEENDAERRMIIAQAPFTPEFLEDLASLGGGVAKVEPALRLPMSTGSSSTSNGGHNRDRAQRQQQQQQQRRRQPVALFGGGNIQGNRSFWPGMKSMSQPTSSARQHGAYARPGSAAPRPPAFTTDWTFPAISSEGCSSSRAGGDGGGGGGGGSGACTQSPGGGDMGGGGKVRVPPSPPSPPAVPASTSWELLQASEDLLRHDDLGFQHQHQHQQHGVTRGVADSSRMVERVGEGGGREAGGGSHATNARAGEAGVSPSQRFGGGGGGEMATAVFDQGHGPQGGLASSSGLRLCAPFTKQQQQQHLQQQQQHLQQQQQHLQQQQQSLAYQVASSSLGSTGMHATWDGDAHTGCAGPSNSSSSSSTPGAWTAASGVTSQLEDMDFLESMLAPGF